MGGCRKSSTPAGRRRRELQRLRDRYAHAREDAQLAGLIPISSEESLKPEVVPPSIQGEQPLPELIGMAARNGWAVPDEKKPYLVDELISMLENPEYPLKIKVAAFNALRMADQQQWERDHPKESAALRGGVSVTTNVGVGVSVFDRAAEYEEQLRKRLITEEGSTIQSNGAGQQVDPPHTNGQTK